MTETKEPAKRKQARKGDGSIFWHEGKGYGEGGKKGAPVTVVAGIGVCPSEFGARWALSRTTACPMCFPVIRAHRLGAQTLLPL